MLNQLLELTLENFLNRIKDLEDPDFPGGHNISLISDDEVADFKAMTEGGGGGTR